VVLNTVEYNQKIGALLEDVAYRRLAKDPTEVVECKTMLLLKKSSLAEEVCKDYVPRILNLQGYMDSPRFIKRESL
jgi:hypothetical protein